MDRRGFLRTAAGALAASGTLAAPRLSLAADSKVLRFVPQANLANLDPIWTTLYVVRNASVLFYDTLYGVDSNLVPQPQMCEGSDVSSDGLIWTFKLRAGLKFHDNEPVRSADCIASLARWMVRDNMGQMIKARLDAMQTVDDRTFRLRLKQPFRQAALCARQVRHALRLHHAGAHRRDRSVQADRRVCRLRPVHLPQGRVGARRIRRV